MATPTEVRSLSAAASMAVTDVLLGQVSGRTLKITPDILPFVQSGTGTIARTMEAKGREVELNLNDFTTDAQAVAAAITSGQALFAPFGTTDLTGWTQDSADSAFVFLGKRDATLDAADAENFVDADGGDIIISGLTFNDWTTVVDSPQATTPTTDYLEVSYCNFTSSFAPLQIESPLTEGVIIFNRFDTLTGAAVKVGYNNYSLQDNWVDLRLIGNRATSIVPASAIDTYFSQINGKHAVVALNQIDTVTGNGAGEVFGLYSKQRYEVIIGNNIRGLTTSGSANPCAIQLKGSGRGVTNDGVNGFANLVSSNMLLGTTGRGIESHVDDVAIVGNYVEGFTLGIFPGSDADGNLVGVNRIQGPAAAAGNYGISVNASGDDQLIVGNLIDTVDRAINLAQSSERNINVVGNTIAECDGIAIQQSGTCALLSVVGNTVDGADRALTIGGTVSRFLGVANNWAAMVDAADRALELSGVTSGLLDANAPFEITTTGTGANNIFRVTLPTNTVAWVEATVVGTEAGADRAIYKIGGLFHNAAGTATQEGSTVDLITAIESDATWPGPTFSPTGSTVRLQVEGIAATTINWSATVKVQLVT